MAVYGLGSPSWNGIWPEAKLSIVPESTCFICYIIPNLWIKKTLIV